MKYVQIQKNCNYTLQFNLNEPNESLFLRLQIEQPQINKIYVYQSQIKSNTQIGQMFGGLAGLTEYLEDPSITKIDVQEEHLELKIVSKNLVKGKQRQIDLYKINFQRTSDITSVVKKQSALFQKQMRKLEEEKQNIQNEDLKRILIKIIRQITDNSKEIRAQIQTRINLSDMINRSIEKQLMIGFQQQAIKDKFRSVNQRVQVLLQRVKRQSARQQQSQRQAQMRERILRNQLQQQIKGVKETNFLKMKLCYQEIQQLGQKIAQIQKIKKEIKRLQKQLSLQIHEKIAEQNYQIQKIKTEISRLQKQFSHQVMFKKNLPIIQHSHFHSLDIEKFGHLLQFSKTMKNQKIRLINDYSIQGLDDSRGKIAIIGPSIEDRKKYLSNSQISVVLKVNKLSANVLLGICDIDEVKTLRYKIESWALAKHGGYYMNSGSYTYSSYRNEDNNQMKGFKFYDGETIKITCDTNKKRITFSNKNEQFSMAYRPNLDENKLFFGVVLHKDGSAVEIVQ